MDTGRYLEAIVHGKKNQKNAIIRRERALFDGGKLMTPSFVLRQVDREVKRIAQAGWGVILSGSPRTLFEAKGLLPSLSKEFGRKNVFVFILDIPKEVSVKRNSNRYICRVCEAPLLSEFYPIRHPKHCPVCGGPLYKRTLDNPKIILTRLEEYENRTKPIFELMKERGYRLIRLDGRPAPYRLFQTIYGHLEK
jgi:adenylate kinase